MSSPNTRPLAPEERELLGNKTGATRLSGVVLRALPKIIEKLKHQPEHNPPKTQETAEQPNKPSLIAEMSRIEHEVRRRFGDASTHDRENIVRYVGRLIRNLKRQAENE